MADTLSISLTPGYLMADGELLTNAILRLIARPGITLTGSIGSATLSDGAVTTAKLADGALSADTTGRAKMADGFLTAAKLNASQDWSALTLTGNPAVTWTGAINFSGAAFTPPPGMLVQQVYNSTATASTITAVIPEDDTIPQNTEGTEVLTLAITPKSATNILEIEILVPFSLNIFGPSSPAVALLFQDSTANALAVTAQLLTDSGRMSQVLLRHRMVAGTASDTTFKLRVGTNSGATLTINGTNGTRQYGGMSRVQFFIKEITA
jgi:hypothetical protein